MDSTWRSIRTDARSEETLGRIVQTTQGVVVHDRTRDPAVLGQYAGLWLDLLSSEDAAYDALAGQQRISVEEFEVAGQLLDAVDGLRTRRYVSG